MNLDEIFLQTYLKDYAQREKQKLNHSQEDRLIANEKKKKLVVIEQFLQKFVDLEVVVHNKDKYNTSISILEDIIPQKFKFYLVDSSKSWSPGISIFFDHPCEVEIAIPNKIEDGVIIIKVASHHPDAYMLEQQYQNMESACKALARFLSKNTVKINKDPRQYIRENFKLKNQDNESKKEIDTNNNSMKKISDFFHLNKEKTKDE